VPGQQRPAGPAAASYGGGEILTPPHPGRCGKHSDLPGLGPEKAGQTLIRARPLRRRADRIARPALVRMRSLKPCVLARRRLFGWNVRLLTGTPGTDLGLGPAAAISAHAGLATVEVAGSAHVTRTPGHRSNQQGPAHRVEAPVCLRSPPSAPRLWTTLRPGVARGGHAGPIHRHPSRAIRAHRDIRRAQPVDKAVDHTEFEQTGGREGWTTNE